MLTVSSVANLVNVNVWLLDPVDLRNANCICERVFCKMWCETLCDWLSGRCLIRRLSVAVVAAVMCRICSHANVLSIMKSVGLFVLMRVTIFTPVQSMTS